MHGIKKLLINIRHTWPKPCQHFPLAQSLVHSGFFYQQTYVREDVKTIEKEYQNLTCKIIQDFKGIIFFICKINLSNQCSLTKIKPLQY